MSFNKSLSIRRREKDIFKLRAASYLVNACEQQSSYQIQFKGPHNTPYEKGKWTINLYLPQQYPYKSPSVGFLNKIYHPNIDLSSGSVCLDVINQTWTPMYELVNIFQIFLPQLLTYPNPSSPLNHQAATLYSNDLQKYSSKVMQYIEKYAFNQEMLEKVQKEIKQMQDCKPKIIIVIQQGKDHQSSICDDGSSLSDHNSLDEQDQLNLY